MHNFPGTVLLLALTRRRNSSKIISAKNKRMRSSSCSNLTSIIGIELECLLIPNDVEKGWYGRIKGVGPAHNKLVNTEQEDVPIN